MNDITLHRIPRCAAYLLALLVLLVALKGARCAPADAAPIAFGTLQTDEAHAAREYAGGTRLAMMEIFWDRYEKENGVFDDAYAAEQRRRLRMFREMGFQVTLALGAHYPPKWLAREPDATFVNQNGESSRDLNFVFNRSLRRYMERYLARVDADLGLENFQAIRLTSVGNAELLYPGGGTYWAFDVNAQNGPNRPDDLPRCPHPGWKPGREGLTPEQVREWADWYVRCLSLTADWQMKAIDRLGFTGRYQILTPGSGARPSGYERAIGKRLPDGIVGVGAVWHKIYEFLPDKRRAVVYVSSVADGSGGDDATQPGDEKVALTDPAADRWSATRWQVRIAREYGLPVGGENPGYNAPAKHNARYVDPSPSGMMTRAMAQATAGRFQCFYWAHSARLWDGTVPFSRYAEAIAAANAGEMAPTSPDAPTPAATKTLRETVSVLLDPQDPAASRYPVAGVQAIRAGDRIVTRNPATGAKQVKTVTRVSRRTAYEVVRSATRERRPEGVPAIDFEVEDDPAGFTATAGGSRSSAWIIPNSLSDEEERAVLRTLSHLDAGTRPSEIQPQGWGRSFRNYEGSLPGARGAGGYREYDVPPPSGTRHRGPRRLVVRDSDGSVYYTWTHYGDAGSPAFVRVR